MCRLLILTEKEISLVRTVFEFTPSESSRKKN